MRLQRQVDAVTAFNTIYDHLKVVQFCAPKGIHVMVEKPLAVSLEHAREMERLANEHGIHLLTNYETSWYGSNYEAFRLVHNEGAIGDIRRIVFNTGHPGPIEIGCNEEFLEWLTDPMLNGGGALTDFGCYGANLATWLMNGQTPETVSCITKQIKPDLYPEVEDEAAITLSYPDALVQINASWNWSHNRKDMTVYGVHGYVNCLNGSAIIVMESEETGASAENAPDLPRGIDDPFALMHAVIKEGYSLPDMDPSSIENNMIVMQILEAAKKSARQNRVVRLTDL